MDNLPNETKPSASDVQAHPEAMDAAGTGEPRRPALGGQNADSGRRLPVDVARSIIPIYEREYRELSDNWTTIERKAQLSAAAAGTILTVGLGFLGNERFSLPGIYNLAFPLAAVGVAGALLAALGALWVTDETLPPAGEDLRNLAWEVSPAGMIVDPDHFEIESLHLKLVHWDTACKDLHSSLARKGSRVRCAQRFLLGTALVFLTVVGGVGILEWRAAGVAPTPVVAPESQ